MPQVDLSYDSALLRYVRTELFAWWDANARDLPWRFGRTSPWGVLVSEVMSQQTQMSRVVPYWQSWMEVWPTPRALAAASPAEVITAWGRLGYPRRALRLQQCARVVSERYHGVLPDTYDELMDLPGIGDYTASAVLSFAFGHRIVVLDTNIRRVLSRVFLGEESLGGAATGSDCDLAESVLPPKDSTGAVAQLDDGKFTGGRKPGKGRIKRGTTQTSVKWNQSVMELGALVCTAKSPLCESCPLADSCAFLKAGRPHLGEKRTRPRQRFKGTNRQVRGIVLEALRALDGTSQVRLERSKVDRLWGDKVQLDSCIASLDEDGLIVIYKDGSLSLPA